MVTKGKTTPFSLWMYAKEFADAGKIVRTNIGSTVSMPALFLFGQSTELSLKAFLLGRGISLDDLKNKPYGHNLKELLKEARRRRLGLEVKLKPVDLGVIGLLNYEYLPRRYQYSQKEKGDTMYVPTLELAEATAFKLVRGLYLYCGKHS